MILLLFELSSFLDPRKILHFSGICSCFQVVITSRDIVGSVTTAISNFSTPPDQKRGVGATTLSTAVTGSVASTPVLESMMVFVCFQARRTLVYKSLVSPSITRVARASLSLMLPYIILLVCGLLAICLLSFCFGTQAESAREAVARELRERALRLVESKQ